MWKYNPMSHTPYEGRVVPAQRVATQGMVETGSLAHMQRRESSLSALGIFGWVVPNTELVQNTEHASLGVRTCNLDVQ